MMPVPRLAAAQGAIAAHALHAGAVVLTFDQDFNRIPGLTVLDHLP